MSKYVFSGLESAGKSLKLAMEAERIVIRNSNWYKKSGVVRPIWSNLKFSENFEFWAHKMNVPIFYWRTLNELVLISHSDVFIDEIGNFFDSRGWESLTLDTRVWLTQGSKCGVELYCTAQDFAQIDKAFRRLIKAGNLVHVSKFIGSPRPSATRPPIKRIWGICYMRDIDPHGYDEDKPKFISFIPIPFLIKKKYCEIFDTGQIIERSPPLPLTKVVRICPEDGYRQVRYY